MLTFTITFPFCPFSRTIIKIHQMVELERDPLQSLKHKYHTLNEFQILNCSISTTEQIGKKLLPKLAVRKELTKDHHKSVEFLSR